MTWRFHLGICTRKRGVRNRPVLPSLAKGLKGQNLALNPLQMALVGRIVAYRQRDGSYLEDEVGTCRAGGKQFCYETSPDRVLSRRGSRIRFPRAPPILRVSLQHTRGRNPGERFGAG